jgi:hypothetical protein
MSRGRSVITVSFLLFLITTQVFAGPSKKLVKKAIEDFNTEMRKIRSDHLLLPVNYLEHQGEVYGYFVPRRLVRLAGEGELFHIKNFKTKKKHVRLELESEYRAKIVLLIYDNDDLSQVFLDEVVPLVLHDLFEYGEAPLKPAYVGNTTSKLLHLGSCNHLPSSDQRTEFPSIATGEEAGYRTCPLCFTEDTVLPIEGFGFVREQAVERARRFEVAFPPVADVRAQEELKALGERVVANFPIETAGFDYEFKIVQSNLVQAVTFPTGFIFITEMLKSAIEDQAELEFILAHEIAHCELHLPPLAPPGPAILAMKRFNETVSDLIAVHFIRQKEGGETAVESAARVLRKMQYAMGEPPKEQEGKFSTHPDFATRLEFLELDRYKPFEGDKVFVGLGKNKEVLIRIRTLGKRKGDEETSIFFLVEGTDLLNKPVEPPNPYEKGGCHEVGKLKDANGKKHGLNEWVFAPTLYSGRATVWQARAGGEGNFEKISIQDPLEISFCGISEVKDWVVYEE